MRVALLGFIVLFSFPLFSQAKHPFTFEDMMALKRVEEPVVSPDGKWVLFAAVDVDLKANTKTPHVWVVPLSWDSDAHVSQKQGDMGHPALECVQGGEKDTFVCGKRFGGRGRPPHTVWFFNGSQRPHPVPKGGTRVGHPECCSRPHAGGL